MPTGRDTTCLVIGGRGFVGSAMAQAATDAGWQVTAVGREDYDGQTRRRFDVVINASGNARRFKAIHDPLWDFDQSVRSIYQSTFDLYFAHYVLISSVDVYNDSSSPATTSENVAIDPRGLSPYAFHKLLAERCVMNHAPSWQILRLAQMVGPGLKKGPVFDLLKRQPLWIHPRSEFPFLSTREAAATAIRLIERAPRNQIYNVCGRGSVRFHRVLELFAGVHDDIIFADKVRQTYRINTEKTHGWRALPESWSEIRDFVAATSPPTQPQ